MLLATVLAIVSPLHNEKIDGPAPEIPEPKAPFCSAAFFTLSKLVIKCFLAGSTMTSFSERPMSS